MTRQLPHVSDHALLRYLERMRGIDIEKARAEIAARVADGVQLGASAVVSGGHRFTLSGNTVTSVVPVRSHVARLPRPHEREGEEA